MKAKVIWTFQLFNKRDFFQFGPRFGELGSHENKIAKTHYDGGKLPFFAETKITLILIKCWLIMI